MKVCTIVFGLLMACVVAMAAEHGPLLTILQQRHKREVPEMVLVDPSEDNNRDKRSVLLGLGVLGAGAVGAGVLGAGLLGAGVVGAKAGFVGGALTAGALSGRGYYGGYGGYYGGYGGYYGGYGGYSGHYRRYYPSYVVAAW